MRFQLLTLGAIAVTLYALLAPRAPTWMLIPALTVLATLIWHHWDRQRGPSAAIDTLKTRWSRGQAMGLRGGQLWFFDAPLPIGVHLQDVQGRAVATFQIPTSRSTTAFAIHPEGQDRLNLPTATVSWARLSHLPHLSRAIGPPFSVYGDDPKRIQNLLNPTATEALHDHWRAHQNDFVGLTFDGTHLSVHWQGQALEQPRTLGHLSWRLLDALVNPPRPEAPTDVLPNSVQI